MPKALRHSQPGHGPGGLERMEGLLEMRSERLADALELTAEQRAYFRQSRWHGRESAALLAELGIARGEYVRLVSRRSDAVVMAMPTQRVAKNMVFLPFHFHDCANRLTLGLLDPHSRQPAYKQSAVRIERINDQQAAAKLSMEMRKF